MKKIDQKALAKVIADRDFDGLLALVQPFIVSREEQVRAALEESGGKVMEAAAALGLHHSIVRNTAAQYGIPIQRMRHRSPDDYRAALEEVGGNITQAAAALGVHRTTVSEMAERYGIPTSPGRPTGRPTGKKNPAVSDALRAYNREAKRRERAKKKKGQQ